MELAIVELARRMRTAYVDSLGLNAMPFDACSVETRRAWVAAAIVARPDLVAGIAVPEDSWLAGVLPTFSLRDLGIDEPPAAGEVG